MNILLSEVHKLHSNGTGEAREHVRAANTTEEACVCELHSLKSTWLENKTLQSAGIFQCQKLVNDFLQTPLLGHSEDLLLWWSTLGFQLYSSVAT